MHIYKIGYSTCEESSYFEVYHENYFTDQQFKKIVADCIVESVDDELIKQSIDIEIINFQDLFRCDIIKYLEKHGFKAVRYTHTVDFKGWSSVINNITSAGIDDWDIGEYQKKIHERVRDKINKKIKESK